MEISNSNLKKGVSEMLILRLLSKEDMYGYQISQTITKLSDNLFTLPEGSLYPILYRLLEKGFITDKQKIVGKRLRNYYHLENAGKTYLKEIIDGYNKLSTIITNILKS